MPRKQSHKKSFGARTRVTEDTIFKLIQKMPRLGLEPRTTRLDGDVDLRGIPLLDKNLQVNV